MTHSCDCLICHVIILKLIILGEEKNIFILKGFNDPHEDRLILYYRRDVISPVPLQEQYHIRQHNTILEIEAQFRGSRDN